MKIVIQRVSSAIVDVDGKTVGSIAKGALILLGIGHEDTKEAVDYYVKKVSELRMFEDENGKMNLSAKDAGGAFLVVSQFTLYGDCSKGRRPSFDKAADPEIAEEIYEYFVKQLIAEGFNVETGRFKAMMNVSLVNDGPVTFILESPDD